MSDNDLDFVPIQDLSPTLQSLDQKAIQGIITVLWPYSSSTGKIAFLLAHPDFRFRGRKGQIRIQFSAASAKAVAQTKTGIGDEVILHLEGSRWIESVQGVVTPGKSVDGELLFEDRLVMQVSTIPIRDQRLF